MINGAARQRRRRGATSGGCGAAGPVVPAAVVEVLGVAVGVVLEGGRDGRPAGVAADDALALPH